MACSFAYADHQRFSHNAVIPLPVRSAVSLSPEPDYVWSCTIATFQMQLTFERHFSGRSTLPHHEMLHSTLSWKFLVSILQTAHIWANTGVVFRELSGPRWGAYSAPKPPAEFGWVTHRYATPSPLQSQQIYELGCPSLG